MSAVVMNVWNGSKPMFDYFICLVQNDRTHYDYGHTRLQREPVPAPLVWRFLGAVLCWVVGFVALAFIMAVLP